MSRPCAAQSRGAWPAALSNSASLRGAKRRSNPDVAAGLDCFAALAMTKERLSFRLAHGKKRKRNAGRRSISCPARKRRAGRATESCGLRRPPLAGALASRRSTTALARGTRHPKGSARARLPGTWPKRSVLDARPNRGAETSRSLCGHYSRPEPVPVQRCTPHAGRSAGRHDARNRPGARLMRPRPQAPHSPQPDGITIRRPSLSELDSPVM